MEFGNQLGGFEVVKFENVEQETRDSEEEKFHRPLNDEQLFFHAVSSGDIDFVRQNCKEKKFTIGSQTAVNLFKMQ